MDWIIPIMVKEYPELIGFRKESDPFVPFDDRPCKGEHIFTYNSNNNKEQIEKGTICACGETEIDYRICPECGQKMIIAKRIK